MDIAKTNTEEHQLTSTEIIQKRETLAQRIEHDTKNRLSRIEKEFSDGFELMAKYSNTVTFFGSTRFTEENPYYQKARQLGEILSDDGYTIITGGGGGIMEAGNRGAFEAGGNSIGFNIELPHEQVLNSYTTDSMPLKYFFSRKVLLAFAAEAYIYFPGGYGTLDEFFEIITLIQTKKVPEVPIICIGDDFWQPLESFMKERMLEGFHTISPDDSKLFTITEDIEVIRTILDKQKEKRITEVLTAAAI